MNEGKSMDRYIQDFADLLLEGVDIGAAYHFKNKSCTVNITNVVLLGLGGSGIGAEVASNYLMGSIKVPVVLCKDYALPEFVNEGSLVIASSYSGNTEETLCALKKAIERKAQIACVTSGGEMKAIAESNELNCILLPAGMPPRACFSCSLAQVLFIFKHYKLANEEFVEELKASGRFLKAEDENLRSMAKSLAGSLLGKLPVIYVDQKISGVGTRWRQQLNENSKVLGWERVIPEMNHNELVGWRDTNEGIAVLLLYTGMETPSIKKRFEITKEVAKTCTEHVFDVHARGDSFLGKMLYLILLGDWVSWYLAELRGVDAVEVKVIDHLKASLEQ